MDPIAESKLFLEPRSVAVIGVSRHLGEDPVNIFQNLINYGFPGKLYPVNPNASELFGIKCYPSVRQIPGPVDLAVVTTGRSQAVPVVKECVEAGVKAIIVVTQGFADADAEGWGMQQEMVRLARTNGTRIIGPNTFGTANAFHSFSTSFRGLDMDRSPIGIICQSGFFFIGRRDFKFLGKGIDLGNGCDVDFADALEYFEHDPQIEVIVMHIEGLRNGRKFMHVASRVAQRKPILVLKTGRSGQGARAAASHTGSLTGSDRVYDAMFKQTGLIRVEDLDDMEDTAKAFLHLPLPKGNRVAIFSATGAGGTIAADACDRYGMAVARFSATTAKKLETLCPPWFRAGSPFDFWPAVMISGRPYREVYRTTLQALLADDGVDAALSICPAFPHIKARDVSGALTQVADAFPGKPVVTWAYSPRFGQEMERLEATGKTVVYPTPDRAIRALSRLAQRQRFLDTVIGTTNVEIRVAAS